MQTLGLELSSGEIDLGAAESVASKLGFDLRPPQRAIIKSMARGRDGLYILGTGGGKSLCYVLPALAASPAGEAGGLTVLVVPLESLRVDQVRTPRSCNGRRASYRLLSPLLQSPERERDF